MSTRTRSGTQNGSRLFAIYALATLVPMLILGVVVNRMIREEIDDRAMTEAVNRAETISDATVEPAIGDRLGSTLTVAQRHRLIVATASLTGDARVLRLRIRGIDGTILFDLAHPNAPAEPAPPDDEIDEAADGKPVATLTRVGSDQVDGGTNTGPQAVETYVAFQAPGQRRTLGVMETYIPYRPFADAAAASKARLTKALVLGLLILWGVLSLITWSVSRRLRASARENEWLARHDQLTALPNRLAFAEEIDARVARHERVLVAELDVARFRDVNETVGQANGDRFLCEVANRLAAALDADGFVARLAGDQFGLLWPGGGSDPERQMFTALTAALAEQITVADIRVRAELTIGFVSTGQIPGTAADLLRAADLAAHAAKAAGVSTKRYTPELEQFDPDRLQLAGELGAAIAAGELVLHYQPKLNLLTSTVSSVEALVRWQHPRRGLLDPAEFIGIAENTNLIGPLTSWVVTESVQQIKSWQLMDPPIGLSVSVNISARSLTSPELADEILDILATTDVPAERLQVELTETSVVADPTGAFKLLSRLADAGVHISLDDFGQGATSLVSLTSLPIHEIKIDRSFVIGLEEGDDQAAVVEFVIALGQRLGLVVVAEGIETERAATLLTAMGCEQGQGYRFCHPLPPRELERWLRGHQRSLADDANDAG